MINKFILFLILPFFLITPAVHAKDSGKDAVPDAFHATKLPLPRFVTLQAKEVHVRSGPGMKYPIRQVYKRPGLPVEVVLEYEVWRKIKDFDGKTGWVHQSLVSGNRAGIIRYPADIMEKYKKDKAAEKDQKKNVKDDAQKVELPDIPIYQKPWPDARWVAKAQRGAIAQLLECPKGWCLIEANGYKGWIERKYLWGVYQNEVFD